MTRDGGMTFSTPLTIANGALSAFARLASGTVLVGALMNLPGGGGGTMGAGYRSTDGAMTFSPWTLTPSRTWSVSASASSARAVDALPVGQELQRRLGAGHLDR